MLVEVPAPPWITSTAKLVVQGSPARISSQAATIASQRAASSRPSSRLASAAACLIAASARIRSGQVASVVPVIGKFSTARRVWMPQ